MPIIWIFTEDEGDGIEFRLSSHIFYTLNVKNDWEIFFQMLWLSQNISTLSLFQWISNQFFTYKIILLIIQIFPLDLQATGRNKFKNNFQLKPCMLYLDAATSSGILKVKQKLGVTFNSDKLGGIDFTKFSKLSSAGAGRCWLVQWPGLPPRHCTWSVLKFL